MFSDSHVVLIVRSTRHDTLIKNNKKHLSMLEEITQVSRCVATALFTNHFRTQNTPLLEIKPSRGSQTRYFWVIFKNVLILLFLPRATAERKPQGNLIWYFPVMIQFPAPLGNGTRQSCFTSVDVHLMTNREMVWITKHAQCARNYFKRLHCFWKCLIFPSPFSIPFQSILCIWTSDTVSLSKTEL